MNGSANPTVKNAERHEKLSNFLPWMTGRIKGQHEVLLALDEHFGRSEQGLTEPGYVLGGFLFVGPTGVGKTETTLLFSEYFFGPAAIARFNMAEFKEAKSVVELRDRMAQAKRSGKRVFLIDEIEKAHWEVLDLLLAILDKGAEIAAPNGETIRFTDSYLVMTSNLGAREAMRSRTRNYTSFFNTVLEYVRRYLRPELLGRLEAVGTVMVFRRLEEPEQRALAHFHTERVIQRMSEQGHRLEMAPDAFEYVVRSGFSDEYGARPLLGIIRKSVEGAVSTALRAGNATAGLLVADPEGHGLRIVQRDTAIRLG